MSKAIDLLIEYMNINFGCDTEEHIKECEEAIADIEAYKEPQTSCHGCKYDDSDVDEAERKVHCLPCLEPITLRKNYTVPDDVLQAKH